MAPKESPDRSEILSLSLSLPLSLPLSLSLSLSCLPSSRRESRGCTGWDAADAIVLWKFQSEEILPRSAFHVAPIDQFDDSIAVGRTRDLSCGTARLEPCFSAPLSFRRTRSVDFN